MTLTETGPRQLVLPRWGTPRNPDRDTLGGQVADVAARLGLPPMPHQRHIFDVAFELDPDTGELWYSEADVWVMRQCGKTMGVLFPVMVHRLTMMPHRLGGRQRCSFTMQDRQETRKKLEIDLIPQLDAAPDSFRRITNPKARPGRSTREWKSSLNNGSEHLLFGRGNYLLIETPSERAGHGGTLDVKCADEVRFGVDDRLEASAGPAQITRRSSQLWVASTAGDEKSFYMWPKVLGGRRRIERGDTETRVCSFEWSIPEDADLHDPDVWWEHHPAVGHTITVADILAELRKAEDSPDESKIDTFRQEYANQWVRTPQIGDIGRELVIPSDVWSSRADWERFDGPWAFGVDVSPDGRSASIASAGRNPSGRLQVEVIDLQAGVFWLEDRLAGLVAEHQPIAVAYDAGGPANALAGQIARAAGTTPIVRLTGREYTAACEAFRVGMVEGRYCHLGQAWLDSAHGGATRKARGDGWLWDRQTALSDISPIVAATVAARAFETQLPPERPPEFFVY